MARRTAPRLARNAERLDHGILVDAATINRQRSRGGVRPVAGQTIRKVALATLVPSGLPLVVRSGPPVSQT
jgi:hypothetical protein